jgi:hypothetical protein
VLACVACLLFFWTLHSFPLALDMSVDSFELESSILTALGGVDGEHAVGALMQVPAQRLTLA